MSGKEGRYSYVGGKGLRYVIYDNHTGKKVADFYSGKDARAEVYRLNGWGKPKNKY